jgi:hypothetical protein
MPHPTSLVRRCYRAGLYLCPPAFRREFGAEMLQDFDDARAEVATRQRRAAWAVNARMGFDLGRTAVLQWLRTGWPLILAGAVIAPVPGVAAVLGLMPRNLFVFPEGEGDREVVGLVLLATVVVLLIATTIILTHWMTPPFPVRRRRR